MPKYGVKKDLRGYKKLKKQMRILSTKEVRIGFFREDKYTGGETAFTGVGIPGHNAGVPVAQIAAYNEYGSRAGRKPRPFMAVAFNDIFRDKKALGQVIASIMKGERVPNALDRLGEYYQKIITNVADFWLMTGDRNSKSWADFKGFNKPLEFTRTMIKSIKFKIKHRKGGE